MDPVETGNSSAAATGKRPSLFGNGQPAATASRPAEPMSILSSLDKNPGKKPLRSGTGLPTWFTIAVGSLLGITIAAAIVISLTRDSGLRAPAKPVLVARAETPERPPEPAVAAAPAIQPAAINAGAAIENAPPAAIAPAAADAANLPVSAAEPAKSATTIAAAAPSAKAEPAAAPSTPSSASPARTVQAEAKAERPTASKKAKLASNDIRTVTASGAPADRDASLLAALVAYGEGKPAAEINANAAAITSPPAKTSQGAATIAQSGQFDPKRDVVVRSATESTAELVRRCRTLGFVEGLLCRTRVCANQWGKDAACPQDAAPAPGRGTE